MRYKHLGIWQPYTWKDYYMNVKYLALDWHRLVLKKEISSLLSGTTPRVYFARWRPSATGNLRGSVLDLTPSELKYIAVNSEASFAMVEDQEQVDKFLSIMESLPKLKKIIYWRYKGLANYKNENIIGHRHLMELGREFEKTIPGILKIVSRMARPTISALSFTLQAPPVNLPRGPSIPTARLDTGPSITCTSIPA